MVFMKKCCFLLELWRGIVIISAFNFVLSILYFIAGSSFPIANSNDTAYYYSFPELKENKNLLIIDIISTLFNTIGALYAVFGFFLLLAISLNRKSYLIPCLVFLVLIFLFHILHLVLECYVTTVFFRILPLLVTIIMTVYSFIAILAFYLLMKESRQPEPRSAESEDT